MPIIEMNTSHANIHHCNSIVNFCTPFFAPNSEYATHSASSTISLDGTQSSILTSTFNSGLLKVNEDYTQIFQVFVFTQDVNGTKYRWDIAFGNMVEVLPEINYSFISTGFKVVCYLMASVLILAVFIFEGWVIWYRNTKVVKYSQPVFLHFILFGAFVSGMSIVAAGVEDSVDDLSGPDGGSNFENAACMGKYWVG